MGYAKEAKNQSDQVCMNLIFRHKGEKENELTGILNGEEIPPGKENESK